MALGQDSAALRGNRALKFIIEILKLDGAGPAQVLHRFSHTASSVHMVWETMKAVYGSPPSEAQGFRILSEAGDELYSWLDEHC
jgi:hypothetical protein